MSRKRRPLPDAPQARALTPDWLRLDDPLPEAEPDDAEVLSVTVNSLPEAPRG
jgi:hypothetical protein